MRKLLLVMLLAVMGIHHPVEAQKMTDLQKLGVKGAVRSIIETKYKVDGANDHPENAMAVSHKMMVFNMEGYETEYYTYQNGEISAKAIYSFASEGQPSKLIEYKPDGAIKHVVIYKNNEKGFRTEAVFFWNEQKDYDENKEKTENYFELFERNLYSKILYVNDYRGLATEEKYLRDNGSLSYEYNYQYDFHGNKLVMSYFNSNGRTSWVTKYKYDRSHNMTESRVYKSNRVAVYSKYTYQFDLYGNWTSRFEEREVTDNVLTQHIERGNFLTERVIAYY